MTLQSVKLTGFVQGGSESGAPVDQLTLSHGNRIEMTYLPKRGCPSSTTVGGPLPNLK